MILCSNSKILQRHILQDKDVEDVKKIPNLVYVAHDDHYIVAYAISWNEIEHILDEFYRTIRITFAKTHVDVKNFGSRGNYLHYTSRNHQKYIVRTCIMQVN